MTLRPITSVIIAALGPFLLIGGCATVPKQGGFTDVQKSVKDRTGKQVRWNQDTPDDHEVELAVAKLLEAKLSADTAVQVALLNNRSLQATYEELGIAQADVVQAGLLTNP